MTNANRTGKLNAKTEPHTIPALLRAMELLEMIASAGEKDCSTKALALELGIPRTTCYRILRSFAARRWIELANDGSFRLASGLAPLVNGARMTERMGEAIGPLLSSLARASRMTTKASVRRGDHAITVAHSNPERNTITVKHDGCFHLALGASGAALLGWADKREVRHILGRAPNTCWQSQTPRDVRARVEHLRAYGWCANWGVHDSRVWAVSVNVVTPDSRSSCAITLLGSPEQLRPGSLPSLLQTLQTSAEEASKELLHLARQ